MKQVRFILRYAKPYHKYVIIILFDVILYTFFMLLGPLIISFLIDHVIQGAPLDVVWLQEWMVQIGIYEMLRSHIWIGSVLILICYVMVGFAINRRSMHTAYLSETFAKNVRDDMYDHLQKLPFSYHKMKDSGDLIQRSTSDIETIRRFLSTQISEMMYAILNVALASLILFYHNVKLTLISISMIPLIFLASFLFFTKVKKIFLRCDIAESNMMTVLQENLSGMRIVKAFHQEKKEIAKFEHYNDAFRKEYFDLLNTFAWFWGCTDFLGQLQILLMLVCGILMAFRGELSLGTFFVFVTYESTIVWPLRQLGRVLSDMGKVSVSIHRIDEVLCEETEELQKGATPEIKGDIVFSHVNFHYEDDLDNTLHDVNLHIHAGEKVAIMGPTGSGKSSFVHLLSGIYDYQKGHIYLDGVELKDISKHWLRKHVQIVLQEPFLFSKTIEENISLANRNSTMEHVKSVACMAAIDRDIEQFDQGYDTAVGEKGVTLSGGQKQRIAIARSLLIDSPVIIFDDSLSALDTKTDAAIQEALQDLKEKKTLLMVTHRIHTAMNADQIIVLEHGHVSQCGTHEQLIKEEGLYKRIYEIQVEGGDVDGKRDDEGTGIS